MSDGFVSSDVVKLVPKFLNFMKRNMGDIHEFSDLLCDRHCWLSKTFYKTQTSSIDVEKRYFLFMVTKM